MDAPEKERAADLEQQPAPATPEREEADAAPRAYAFDGWGMVPLALTPA